MVLPRCGSDHRNVHHGRHLRHSLRVQHLWPVHSLAVDFHDRFIVCTDAKEPRSVLHNLHAYGIELTILKNTQSRTRRRNRSFGARHKKVSVEGQATSLDLRALANKPVAAK